MRRGHVHGSVSTLWRKTLAHKVKPIPCVCNRLACITLDINDNYKILIINRYMPNDNYRVNDVDAEFDEIVYYIEQMYAKMANDVNDVILVGDLSIDLVRNNAHTKCLSDISERLDYTLERIIKKQIMSIHVCMKELIINQILFVMCYLFYYMNV